MKYLYLLFLVSLIGACIKNNPDPAWLEVTSWTLESNPALAGTEGQLTHSITDAWVFVDNKLIGVFEVPFKIPVLKSGVCDIRIYPTIRINGMGASKVRNDHMVPYEISAELVQNQTLTLHPHTHYKDNVQFWIEDFEDVNIKLMDDPNTSSAHLGLANDSLQWFQGNYYGKVALSASDSMWVAYTTDQLSIAKGRMAVLELDYCNSTPFTNYLLFVNASGTTENPMITMNGPIKNTSPKWKKIYLLLNEVIGAAPNNTNYLQAFKSYYLDTVPNNFILLDNIKVVYF
ncbi:MAG: hypothetical protein RLZZ301_1133 [Bacteroidota bacterium]|jgi:hypothetical protein